MLLLAGMALVNLKLIFVEIIIIALVLFFVAFKYIERRKFETLSVKYKNNQQFLAGILKSFPDLIFCKDLDMKYVSCNDAFSKAFGVEIEDIIGKRGVDILSSNQEVDEVQKYDDYVLNTRESVNYFQQIFTHDGGCKIYDIIKAPLISEDGEFSGILGIGRDVTMQKHFQRAFSEKQFQLGAILEYMPFFTYMKDLEGNFVCCNRKVMDLFGKHPEELVNTSSYSLFPEDLVDILREEDARIIQTKETIRVERQIEAVSGMVWLEVDKAPILNDNDEVIGIVVVIKDIGSKKQIEEQKETFVATLIHDLKTPAIAQIKALEVILKGSLGTINGEQKDVLNQIYNSCNYAFNMISNLLTTYKYESGVKNMQYESLDFSALVSECCNEISYLMQEKEQRIIIKNNFVNKFISADRIEIKRVINNLISNAIFYSGKNAEIELSIAGEEENMSFEVKNCSKFIPQERLDKIFDKYFSSASDFRQIGTGLGLYLSKQIITAHNGDVFANSAEDGTNIFGFVLPVNANFSEQGVKELKF